MLSVILVRLAPLLVLAALAACRGQSPSAAPAPMAPGTPEETVRQFIAAANARDLDRMALLWGTERGPSTVTNPNSPTVRRQQLEIMQRNLVTDSHRVTNSETVADHDDQRRLMVELVRGSRRVNVAFTMVTPRSGGWLVLSFDLEAAMSLSRPASN
jgi:hypothetical protein